MEPRLILIQLVLKLGVAAAVSSSLVRSKEFKALLFREQRVFRQKVYLVLAMALPITIGVWIRLSVKSFLAGDLTFETALLLGAIGGRWAGVLGGVLMAIPALMYGEWAALPFGALCGFIAGQLRTLAVDKDDIWSFSPFIDLSIYRLIRRNLPTPRLFDWQIMFFTTIVGLRFVQGQLSRYFPHSIFSLDSSNLWVEAAIYAASAMAIRGAQLQRHRASASVHWSCYDRHHRRRSCSIQLLDELRRDKCRMHRLPPRHHRNQTEIGQRIDGSHGEHRIYDGPRDYASRITHLATDVAVPLHFPRARLSVNA